jgi:hypothetical protein
VDFGIDASEPRKRVRHRLPDHAAVLAVWEYDAGEAGDQRFTISQWMAATAALGLNIKFCLIGSSPVDRAKPLSADP